MRRLVNLVPIKSRENNLKLLRCYRKTRYAVEAETFGAEANRR